MSKAFSHENLANGKDEWLTPQSILLRLDKFDLDPCAAVNQPWRTAAVHYTIADDGLKKDWYGRVWLNPPYNQAKIWLAKLATHGLGTALVYARVETRMFFDYVWDQANAILFIKGRLTFLHADGQKPENTGGAPSCLIAYGRGDADILELSGIAGKFIRLKG